MLKNSSLNEMEVTKVGIFDYQEGKIEYSKKKIEVNTLFFSWVL